MLDGLFFCINTVDDDISYSLKQKEGFVGGARFRDSKNKIINKPKDQWGISSPIEGRIMRESYDCQKVKFNITAKEGTFTDGNMVQNI